MKFNNIQLSDRERILLLEIRKKKVDYYTFPRIV